MTSYNSRSLCFPLFFLSLFLCYFSCGVLLQVSFHAPDIFKVPHVPVIMPGQYAEDADGDGIVTFQEFMADSDPKRMKQSITARYGVVPNGHPRFLETYNKQRRARRSKNGMHSGRQKPKLYSTLEKPDFADSGV